MPKNEGIIDYKPSNKAVIDYKPKSEGIIDFKPNNENIALDTTSQLYEQTLSAGMYMGIPPHTYPETIVVQSPFSP